MKLSVAVLCVVLALTSLGAEVEAVSNDAFDPCFVLYRSGSCSRADFDRAIQCANNLLASHREEYEDVMAIKNVLRLFQNQREKCQDLLHGKDHQSFNVVFAPCRDLYHAGRFCWVVKIEEAIACAQRIRDAGELHKEADRESLISHLNFYQQQKKRCEDQN